MPTRDRPHAVDSVSLKAMSSALLLLRVRDRQRDRCCTLSQIMRQQREHQPQPLVRCIAKSLGRQSAAERPEKRHFPENYRRMKDATTALAAAQVATTRNTSEVSLRVSMKCPISGSPRPANR